MELRILESSGGVRRLQMRDETDLDKCVWHNVPVVKFDRAPCDGCGGSGGDFSSRCNKCDGRGVINSVQRVAE